MRTGMMMLAAATAVTASGANASGSVTVQIAATIPAIQCTPEQRARIRACAPSTQTIAASPYKTMVAVPASTTDPTPTYRIQVHPTAQVLIRTVLY